MDMFSKKVWAKIIPSKEAVQVKNFLLDWKRNNLDNLNLPYNFPVNLQHDNGNEFFASIVRDFIVDNNWRFIRSSVCHPQGQGMIERWHGTMKSHLNNSINQSELNRVVELYNNYIYHCATKELPNVVWYNCVTKYYGKYILFFNNFISIY